MADEMILTPQLLFEQSEQMNSLMSEYETLFTQVRQSCEGINSSWSENLAKNFSGKIQAAQNSFTSITNMFSNGSLAARMVGLTFADGIGLNSMIGSLMGEDGTGALSAGDATKILDMLGTGNYSQSTQSLADVLGGMMGSKDADSSSIVEMAEALRNGDYSKALELGFDKWVDKTAGNLTSGDTDVLGLEKDFYKNWISNPIKDAVEIVKNETSDNPDYAYTGQKLGEFAWHFGPGAVLQTAGEKAWDIAKDIPGVGEYYTSRGATDAESAFGIGFGDISYGLTYGWNGNGTEEDRQYFTNFYSDRGGIASGVVKGVADIASYVWDNGLSSVFNK